TSTINKSLDILKENKYSEMDPLAISLRLDRNYIEAFSADNFSSIKNKIFDEIANGYIVKDSAIVIEGMMHLMRFYMFFNTFYNVPVFMDLIDESKKKYSLKNSYVRDNLILSQLMNNH